jgi:hypothetical protein
MGSVAALNSVKPTHPAAMSTMPRAGMKRAASRTTLTYRAPNRNLELSEVLRDENRRDERRRASRQQPSSAFMSRYARFVHQAEPNSSWHPLRSISHRLMLSSCTRQG